MFGAGVTTAIAERIGTANRLLVSIALLQCAVVCVWRLRSAASAPKGSAGPDGGEAPAVRLGAAEPTRDWLAGLKLLTRSPHLLAVAAYVALMTILATFVYFEQARWVSAIFASDEARTRAFAMIDLPLITVIGFVMLTVAPMFATFVAFQAARRAAQHAIARPIREVLYTIVGPDEKYKSKAFIDTFVYRGGDFVGAWAHHSIAALAVMLAPVATIVGVLWLVIALYLGRLHGRAVQRDAITEKSM